MVGDGHIFAAKLVGAIEDAPRVMPIPDFRSREKVRLEDLIVG